MNDASNVRRIDVHVVDAVNDIMRTATNFIQMGLNQKIPLSKEICIEDAELNDNEVTCYSSLN